MILIQSVESSSGRTRLSKSATVALLVCGAIYANLCAVQRIGEVKQEVAMREQLKRNLSDLIVATDAIAKLHGR